ncbi:MAG TPA: RHS repeat-associated core domain-containing protein, partial [Ktedonobacteraceae bacterium]|nr:RHS repeat-associated core domain-containing protein [Ktedonobacteraceae bacterium]
AGVQNLSYTYDPTGNITHIQDDAQQTIYFRNRSVEPSADYTYDATYRLIEASGREHLGQIANGNGQVPIALTYNDRPRLGILQADDPNTLGRYLQHYVYDEVGNILQMLHSGTDPSQPGWTRAYTYNEASLLESGKFSNRLTGTQIGNGPAEPSYTYDLHGNMLNMPHLPLMQWDYRDMVQATTQQIVSNGGRPETTCYVYDASGQRVRKVTERQAATGQTPTLLKERIYLDGCEIYREYSGDGSTITLERETLLIMDDRQRIALVETRTQGSDGSPAQLLRYQFSNHLGSASLELDEQAQIISYEEYFPYGSTSYQAVRSSTETPKRYRYTGKERDEENGLYYHGARYYACWLGRWTSCDPALMNVQRLDALSSVNSSEVSHKRLFKNTDEGSLLSFCPYIFVENNPCIFVDPDGKSAQLIIEGDTMTIHANVFIYGKEVSETLAQAMETSIEKKWGKNPAGEAWTYKDSKNGKIYNVKFDVKVQLLDKANPQRSLSSIEKYFKDLGGVGSNYIEMMSRSADQRSSVAFDTPLTSKGIGTLYIMGLKTAPPEWTHEFSHLLGLPDRYKDLGEKNKQGEIISTPDPGWEKNVMGDSDKGIVEQRNIDDVIEKLQSNPVTWSDKTHTQFVTPEQERNLDFMLKRDMSEYVATEPHPPNQIPRMR